MEEIGFYWGSLFVVARGGGTANLRSYAEIRFVGGMERASGNCQSLELDLTNVVGSL